MSEKQTCPRRTSEFGPWEHGEGLDQWNSGRWFDTKEQGQEYARDFAAKHPGGSASDYYWQGPGSKPRVCSFCGGVNPDDAVALIEAGWEVETTGKSYKRYLQPPGYHANSAALLERIRSGELDFLPEERKPAPTFAHPTPPVKLYVMHFNAEQVSRFNNALAMNRATEQS